MQALRVVVSAEVPAPPSLVYDLLADFRHGHPTILPPEYFEDLVVEEGGRGAGTRIRFTTKAFGSRRVNRASVTEPEAGRVMVETIEGSEMVTTFIVDPVPSGSRVTFDTFYPKRGFRGWLDGLLIPGYLRKVYVAELAMLKARVVELAGATAAA